MSQGQIQTKPIEDIQASRCPTCGSSERSEYSNRREHVHSGEYDGKPFNRVVWRNCHCLNCGQHRVDRTYEFISDKKFAGRRNQK